ncbi:phosphocholine cytidylyltransferase family protein [Salinarchaeum sp. IM2453]|uniref:phosphocholine cytidylyltransferase family protein n=1 Tax=Salinarchaeum sp. IM2453 TaxID=2862870 RepID=UPI001C831044|nr:phosphocholine cytidylyltransferase family protein [Salinarchaeum sp. IM2453]QZA89098.1 phosphocholine cytidylyltransferase family protein [Salinarchaeum sp. IM2453]
MSSHSSPRVVHLAAGQGTRLRPLTDDRPKPLVELAGKSLLERNLDTLEAVGIDDHVIVTGYMAEEIDALGYETVHNDVYDSTEMVYSLFCAADQFPDDRDLVISYGDIVYDESVVESLLDCDASVCVVVDEAWEELWEARFDDPLSDAETLQCDATGQIESIGAEPTDRSDIEGQYIGLIKIRSDRISAFTDVYEELSDGGSTAVEMTHFLQHLIDHGWDIQAVPVSGGWIEVDTITDLEYYNENIGQSIISHLSWLDAV